MKAVVIAFCLIIAAAPTFAADRAIVSNDQETAALVQLIDEALKAKGVAVAQNAAYWLNKIQNAPVVTSQKEIKPDDKSKEDKEPAQ